MGEVTAKSKANRGNLRHELGVNEGGATINVSAGRRWGSSANKSVGSRTVLNPANSAYLWIVSRSELWIPYLLPCRIQTNT